MSYLEALYGSQYYEIHQRGSDGNKGRLNANLFLSALVIVIISIVIALFYRLSTSFAHNSDYKLFSIFGGMTGKAIGQLLAIPLLASVYFVISKTVGSETNFNVYVDNFMQQPDSEKEKANAKLLIPFLSLVGFLFILLIV